MASSSNNQNPILEVDPALGGDSVYEDSDYKSGLESDTTSLISAARNYTFENGRRYHGYKEGKYMLPNDEPEQDRMDLLHHCCLLALQGELFIAPVGKDWKPQRILDIGTGSGIWAIDAADQYPMAEIIGIDLSPIQPNWVPPNAVFQVDDVEETWSFQENSFDFIHLRNMESSIIDWPKLCLQAWKALKPGGWVEVQCFCDYFVTDDDSLPASNSLTAWVDYFEKASAICGRECQTVAPAMAKRLTDVGYAEVSERVFKFPVGRWPKEKEAKTLGTCWRQHCLDGAEGISLAAFTRILGWEKEKVPEFLAGVYSDVKNPKYHTYTKFYCTYGRKPSA
ncbi:ATPase [Rhizina undulata]